MRAHHRTPPWLGASEALGSPVNGAGRNRVVARDGSKVVGVAQNTFGWPSVEAAAEELYCR